MTDHTEMQIPDDVMEAAEKIVDLISKSIWKGDCIDAVARAILAERNRCHDIAEAAGRYGICDMIIQSVDK